MAILLDTVATPPLKRAETFVDLTKSFTEMFWVNEQTWVANNAIWVTGDITYSAPYLVVSNHASIVNTFYMEIFDGTNFFDTTNFPISVGVWTPISVVYNANTTTVSLYSGTTHLADLVVNLAAVTLTNEALGGDTGGNANLAVGYTRVWQAALTIAELYQEQIKATAVRTTNLLSDTPLTSTALLTDISGNGHTWTAFGTSGPFNIDGPTINLPSQTLFAVGAGMDLAGAIVSTPNGLVWTDLTPELPESDKVLLPMVGVVVI